DKMDKEHEKQLNNQAQECKNAKQEQEQTNCSESTQLPKLQDYCPTGAYVSMVITYPAEVVKFQNTRPDPEPELRGLQRVSINIDDNSFPQIFPEQHAKFLDKLKQHKRRATEEQGVYCLFLSHCMRNVEFSGVCRRTPFNAWVDCPWLA
ncbi:hypothetical protein FBU30_003333, partial [Linnemannia zychae]